MTRPRIACRTLKEPLEPSPLARIGGGLLAILFLAIAAPARAGDGSEFFERRVRPLLKERCVACHGPKKQESGLRLDIRRAAEIGGVSGKAIVAGKPDESLLIGAVRRDGDLKMPPKKPLSDSEVAVLVKWIEMGAKWPAEANDKMVRSGEITDADRRFWSFQPLADPTPPSVRNGSWCASPIDRFILARIEAAGLSPASPADRRALIRRATYDLTGLPPTPARVAEFVRDKSPDAFASLVDELLASPAYGQRWGRHWLDAVRYCDSRDARHTGQPYDVNEAWRYRDWVVDSLNRDRPYDEFVRLQIAGDYAPASASEKDAVEGLIASGMLVIGEWGSGDADAKKMHTDIVDDQIHVVSQTFMGISLSCARCHDHKFDPFSARDYYAMAGIFFSTQVATPTTDAPLMRQPMLTASARKERAATAKRIAEIEENLKRLQDENRSKLRQHLVRHAAEYFDALAEYELPASGRPFAEPIDQTNAAEFCRQRELNPSLFAALHNLLFRLTHKGELLTVAAKDFGAAGVFTWKSKNAQPLFHVNTTDAEARVPGTIPAKSIAVHPTPTTGVAIAWRSPIDGDVTISGRVGDAHAGGGNGIEWTLEHDHGLRVDRLFFGTVDDGRSAPLNASDKPFQRTVRKGEQLRLIVMPRGGNHTCDLTQLDLRITEVGGDQRVWSPQRDVAPNPQQGNPHADAYGHADVWSFTHMSHRTKLLASDSPHQLSALGPWLDAVWMARSDSDRSATTRAAHALQDTLATVTAKGTKADPSALRLLDSLASPTGLVAPHADLAFDADAKAHQDRLKSELADQRKKLQVAPVALSAKEGGVPGTMHAGFGDARVHLRGHYNRLGDVVPRGVPEIIAGADPPQIRSGSGRAELARWITRNNHPLTPRVMVNRIWLHHFGEGLVRTPGNFGAQGERPTHPLLLDWLATRFVESGWSIKSMHRLIMLSSAYQQSTAELHSLDPDNRLIARMTSRRLEVEAIRDTLLFVSGQLDRRMGGPSAPRYPGGYSRAERKPADFSNPRRTLYLMTIRGEYSDGPFVLGAANSNRLVHQRTVSTTAPQALLMMNDPFVAKLAKSLAVRIAASNPTKPAERVAALYEMLYARPPEPREVEAAKRFLASFEKQEAAWEHYCHALMCSNELVYRN